MSYQGHIILNVLECVIRFHRLSVQQFNSQDWSARSASQRSAAQRSAAAEGVQLKMTPYSQPPPKFLRRVITPFSTIASSQDPASALPQLRENVGKVQYRWDVRQETIFGVGSNHEAKLPETFCVHGINSFFCCVNLQHASTTSGAHDCC